MDFLDKKIRIIVAVIGTIYFVSLTDRSMLTYSYFTDHRHFLMLFQLGS